jgi:hypothetical protein
LAECRASSEATVSHIKRDNTRVAAGPVTTFYTGFKGAPSARQAPTGA